MAKVTVVFDEPYTRIVPATVLQTFDLQGNVVQELPVPATTSPYSGEYTLKSKKDAKAFIARFPEGVCRLL
jgi:hypothetical protein